MVRLLAALLVCASAELSFAQDAARPTAIAPGTLEFRDESRLPLQVCDASQGALLVTWVDRDNPASRMTKVGEPQVRGVLETGDLIVQIDCQPVKTSADYFRAMRRAGAQAALTIRDVNSGAEEEWSIDTHQVRVPVPPAAQPNVSKSKLHVVYAAQTNDKDLGEFVILNVPEFQELIGTQIREQRTGSFTTLSGPACNAQQIIAAIDGLNIAPQDSIFVMYQGHGAFAPAIAEGDPAHGHFFQLADGDLPRQEVWHHLLAKRPRFALLMSDCCNVHARPAHQSFFCHREHVLTAFQSGGAGGVSRRSKLAAHKRAALEFEKMGASAPIFSNFAGRHRSAIRHGVLERGSSAGADERIEQAWRLQEVRSGLAHAEEDPGAR